jgi:hypothetical protein
VWPRLDAEKDAPRRQGRLLCVFRLPDMPTHGANLKMAAYLVRAVDCNPAELEELTPGRTYVPLSVPSDVVRCC